MTKKVLILDARISIEDMTKDHIKSTSTLYKYYVGKKLLNMGAKVYCRWAGASREKDWDVFFEGLERYLKENGPFHSVISMAQRGYLSRGKINGKRYYNLLKKYCKKVTTICDNAYEIGFADTTYYATPMRDSDIKNKAHKHFVTNKAKYVGWAADPNTCRIDKKIKDGNVRILIDHSYYEDKPYKDLTNKIVDSASKYMKKNNKVIFKRFLSDIGVDFVKENNNVVEIFNRNNCMKHIDACKEYSSSDIFVVTHPESMGLSVIESAMSGCLILSPKNFIKKTLLGPLHHLEFDEEFDVPWDNAISLINHTKSRALAEKYDWDKVSTLIAKDLLK
jgi:hypothetical protein